MKCLRILLLVGVLLATACSDAQENPQEVLFTVFHVGDELLITQSDYPYVSFGVIGMYANGKYYNAVVKSDGVFAMLGAAITINDTLRVPCMEKFKYGFGDNAVYYDGGEIDSIELEYMITDDVGNYLTSKSIKKMFRVR